MTAATLRPVPPAQTAKRVSPSKASPVSSTPFTLAQELESFGTWAGESIWVPPRDSSSEFAKTMLGRNGLLASRNKCWSGVVEKHRAAFQQVREIDLGKASIRLPKGKLFVSVTEQNRFDEITDVIPNCVQTRLDEFLEGPGKRKGVKVYYLKPLCVEIGGDLIFTTREDILAAITLVQNETFSAYRRMYMTHRPMRSLSNAMDFGMSVSRKIYQNSRRRRKLSPIEAYQAHL